MNNEYSIERAAARQILEKEFEAKLREYILDNGHNQFGIGRKFQFGGAHNFLSTVQSIFEKLGEEFNCYDYKVVAVAMQDVVNTCDFPFQHQTEEDDVRPDAAERAAYYADIANDERKCNGL